MSGPAFPLAGSVEVRADALPPGADPVDGDFLFTTIELTDADLVDVVAAG